MENPKQLRVSDEVFERFRSLAKEAGLTQGEALSAMISVYELSMGTQVYPSVEDDIKAFERSINLLLQLYGTAIKTGQSQRELAIAEVRRTLESRDKIIQDLQDQLMITKDSIKRTDDLAAQLSDATARLATATEELNSLRLIVRSMPDASSVKKLERLNADLKQQVAVLNSQVSEKANTISILMSVTQFPNDPASNA